MSRILPRLSGLVLDVGSGTRPFQNWYTGVHRVVNLDFPPTASNFKGIPPDVWGDGMRLPFRDGSFDAVTCWEVLEHLPDPGSFFAETVRVLSPGGQMVLSVAMSWEVHGEPNDFYRFTPYGIRYLAETHGWKVKEIHPTSGTMALCGLNLSIFIAATLGMGLRPLQFLLRPVFGTVQLLALGLDFLFGRRGHSIHHVAVLERPREKSVSG